MRILLSILAAGLTCAACASNGAPPAPSGGGSYRLEGGTADYDALQRATTLCRARGGALEPRKDADLTELSDYSCVVPKSPNPKSQTAK